MAAARITQEDVFSAARDLVARGENPTTLKAYEWLGRGSYSTITKHLKAWEGSEEAIEAQADKLPPQADVPAELEAEAVAYIKKAWTAAKAVADSQLDLERQALEDAKIQYQQELEQAINLANEATEKREQAEEQAGEYHELLTQCEDKIKSLKSELERTSLQSARQAAEIEHLNNSNDQLNVQAIEAAARADSTGQHNLHLEQQNKEIRSEFNQEIKAARAEHKDELARSTKANQQALDELKRQHLSELTELKAQAESERSNHKAGLTKQEESHANTHSELKSQYAELRMELKAGQEKADRLQGQLTKQAKSLGQAEAETQAAEQAKIELEKHLQSQLIEQAKALEQVEAEALASEQARIDLEKHLQTLENQGKKS